MDLIRAAGGVIVRADAAGEPEVLVVHRPRYDDWSLPKGKLEPGETREQAAVREVAEETGVICEIGDPLPPHHYTDRKGRPKVVYFFLMTPVDTRAWSANDEVDEVAWCTRADAENRLTYDADRQLVAGVMQQE